MQNIETIERGGKVFATILRAGFSAPGIHFFTPDNYSQQLGYMGHPAGKVIEPHLHTEIRREIYFTNEVLFIKHGKVRIDFYGESKEYLESRTLIAGDTVLLVTGGHGFEALEELEMIEVKQGPYAGEQDKVRFAAHRTSDTAGDT